MNLTIRRADDRGKAELGWLKSRHTFSFSSYWDPDHMGFGPLRVINDDRVAPGRGFGPHPHRDMEIISYVLDGALMHKDSMGNGSVIEPGEVQMMSAGTGVVHGEWNASKSVPVRFLQIWIEPERRGEAPGYGQKRFSAQERRGRLRVLASPDGRDGSLAIKQDALLLGTELEDGHEVTVPVDDGRGVWIHVAKGSARVDGQDLGEGDAISTWDTGTLTLRGTGDGAEVLVFDVPGPP